RTHHHRAPHPFPTRRSSDLNLAMTDKIGGEQVTGGCLAVTVFEGTEQQVAARHELTSAVLREAGGTSLGPEPAQAWEHGRFDARSEEHTSELQSREKLVCRL